jgi:hypothetical protein
MNGIIYGSITNSTTPIKAECWLGAPNVDSGNPAVFSFDASLFSGDSVTIAKIAGYNHAFSITGTSATCPNTLSGVIKVIATYNGDQKTFYYGFKLDWIFPLTGNANAIYTVNTPSPAAPSQVGGGGA